MSLECCYLLLQGVKGTRFSSGFKFFFFPRDGSLVTLWKGYIHLKIHKYKIVLGTTFPINYFLVLNCSKQRVHMEFKDAED